MVVMIEGNLDVSEEKEYQEIYFDLTGNSGIMMEYTMLTVNKRSDILKHDELDIKFWIETIDIKYDKI